MQQILEQLGIAPAVVIAQVISFLLLLGILWKFLYAPVSSIMRQREEQIANSLSGAEAQQTRADSLRKEYEARLANIADEARERLDQAMKDAEVARNRVLETAQDEVQTLYQRHQTQMELDREQLRRDLRTEMADIAVLAAGKALRNQMTPAIQSAVVDQVIRELDELPMAQ